LGRVGLQSRLAAEKPVRRAFEAAKLFSKNENYLNPAGIDQSGFCDFYVTAARGVRFFVPAMKPSFPALVCGLV
jgi:hypothetical protein